MSFILDALRKSEHARQREKGPALAEVAVAPPRPRKNIWASVAVALLVVNLVAVGVLLLRRADRNATRAATTTPAVTSSTPNPAPPVATAPGTQAGAGEAAPSIAPSFVEPAPRPVPGTVPPVLQPALPAEGAGGESRNPLADELSGGAAGEGPYDPGYDSGYENGAPYPTAPPGVQGNPAQRRGSVIYETHPDTNPATSPANAGGGVQNPAGAIAGGNVASPGTRSSSLPTLDDLGMQTGLPELHVDIHVYSRKSQERFVFINSRRYKEGDTLQEGPHVDRITPEAVELSYRGNRFALPRQ